MPTQEEIREMEEILGSEDSGAEEEPMDSNEEPNEEEPNEEPIEEEPLEEDPIEENEEDGEPGQEPDLDDEVVDDPEDSEEAEEAIKEESTESSNEADDPRGDGSELDKLRAEVSRLSSKLSEATQPKEEASDNPIDGRIVDKDGKQRQKVLNLASEEEFQEIFENPQTFNKVLTKVYAKAMEDVLKFIPGAVHQNVNEAIATNEQARLFYENNPDLAPYSQYVSVVATEIQQENPDLDLNAFYDAVSQEVRNRLATNGHAVANRPQPPAKKKSRGPAFAGSNRGGRNKTVAPKLTGMEAEMDELLNL